MIILCIRLAKLRSLCIANEKVTGYVKSQGQQDISQVFRSMEKDEEWAKQFLTWIQNAISSEELKDSEKLRAK